jgi:2-keto-4-pentenoate hydratase
MRPAARCSAIRNGTVAERGEDGQTPAMEPSRTPMEPSRTRELAERLQQAWDARLPIEPFTPTGEITTVEDAYAVQRAWARIRADGGETSVGRKIGLTSPGMQAQMGVHEPDFGDLWASRAFASPDGIAEMPAARFIQPRVEGELAFLLGSELAGPGVTDDDVLAASVAVAPAIEVVDSRIAEWRIGLLDTIADNASYGAFALGEWSEELLGEDLRQVQLSVSHNDQTIVCEHGSAVLGSPLAAVAWLANKLGSFGEPIRAGDVVLSGSFGPAAAAVAGDAFTVEVPGHRPVRVRFLDTPCGAD